MQLTRAWNFELTARRNDVTLRVRTATQKLFFDVRAAFDFSELNSVRLNEKFFN